MRLLLALFFALIATASDAQPLASVRNVELVSLLAFQTIFAEKQVGGHSVKIILAPYTWGECWGTIKPCPDLRLFISVVPDGLNEKARLYRLPNANGWVFGEWLTTTSTEDSGFENIGFTVQTALPDAKYRSQET